MNAIDTTAFASGRPQVTSAEIEAWFDRAVVVTATGLDMGVRRRVGISHDLPGGAREVVGWGDVVTKFPEKNSGYVTFLSAEDRAGLRRWIYKQEGLPLNDGAV